MPRTRTALVLMVLLIAAPLAAAVDARDATLVDTTQTLSSDTTYADGFTVTNGATFTVEANISVGENAVIRVDEGATLNLHNANLTGSDIEAYMAFSGGASTVVLPVAGLTGSATVRLLMSSTLNGTESLTVTASTGESVSDPTGDEVNLQVDLGDGMDTLTLNVTHNHPFPFGPTAVEVVDASANMQRHEAWALDGTDLVLTWGDAAFSMDVQGTLIIADSHVRGADIRCSGACSIDRSTMEGSAPIIAEDGASLSIRSSLILGSRTDEDVVAVDDASLVYEDSTGTGGWTDAWIRRLSGRTVTTNMPGALVSGSDLGYKGTKSPNAFAETMGEEVGVDLGSSEMTRIVEWLTGDGVYGKEDGTMTVTATTGWGTFTPPFRPNGPQRVWSTSNSPDRGCCSRGRGAHRHGQRKPWRDADRAKQWHCRCSLPCAGMHRERRSRRHLAELHPTLHLRRTPCRQRDGHPTHLEDAQ